MIRTLLLGLALVIATADGASAKKVWGAGFTSCRVWQKNRAADNADSLQQRSWIAGYLSGHNVASWGSDFLEPKPDADAMWTWIDNYCKDKPLAHLMEAVTALKNELEARAP
ncbi:hypothetical protein [Ensifer sp.]|uniref:hypothetical protein n=1 Tax=Ensifer sp. TaxID=1872086 RepID=UPI0028A02B91|nr:hypothetical protein [Ensifer sp.]